MNKTGRYSKQRDAVLTLLKSTKSHPTAEWLYNELKEDFPGIGIATIYRNLKLFCQQGLVQKIEVGDGLDHFDADISQHYHFYCTNCGRVIDVDMPPLEINHALPCGLVAERHQLTFFGKCNECKKEQDS